MTRQWLNCPGTETHAARLEHIKTLATAEERRAYLAQVRSEHGLFWSHYLGEEFLAWWPTRDKESA